MLCGILLGLGIPSFLLLDPLTAHAGETAILLMPPVFGALLWFGWPQRRPRRWWHIPGYLAVMTPIIAGATWFAAAQVRGRVLWREVMWALYFLAAWRISWELWRRTVGTLGERWRRWGRRARRAAGGWRSIELPRRRRAALAAGLISPARALLVALVFAPLFMGSLIHRLKIGNPVEPSDAPGLPLEEVRFSTADGLRLSGWFVPERGSDSTVIICHGAGANKANFAGYLLLFVGSGYNALIFDARGHGNSDGHTSTFGLFETADVRAAVDWLKTERPRQSVHVYGLGSSMGAMTLVRAAADDPRIEAVVLDSCFVSAPLLGEQHARRLPVVGPAYAKLIMAAMSLHAGRSFWTLSAADAIAAISPRPVLLIHGDRDIMIPPENLDLLYDQAREPKAKWLGPGLHSNVLNEDFDGYQKRVLDLFKQARGAS
jgi:fermentation-respiration switch protein FrsA (DUF1100 family)